MKKKGINKELEDSVSDSNIKDYCPERKKETRESIDGSERERKL